MDRCDIGERLTEDSHYYGYIINDFYAAVFGHFILLYPLPANDCESELSCISIDLPAVLVDLGHRIAPSATLTRSLFAFAFTLSFSNIAIIEF